MRENNNNKKLVVLGIKNQPSDLRGLKGAPNGVKGEGEAFKGQFTILDGIADIDSTVLRQLGLALEMIQKQPQTPSMALDRLTNEKFIKSYSKILWVLSTLIFSHESISNSCFHSLN